MSSRRSTGASEAFERTRSMTSSRSPGIFQKNCVCWIPITGSRFPTRGAGGYSTTSQISLAEREPELTCEEHKDEKPLKKSRLATALLSIWRPGTLIRNPSDLSDSQAGPRTPRMHQALPLQGENNKRRIPLYLHQKAIIANGSARTWAIGGDSLNSREGDFTRHLKGYRRLVESPPLA